MAAFTVWLRYQVSTTAAEYVLRNFVTLSEPSGPSTLQFVVLVLVVVALASVLFCLPGIAVRVLLPDALEQRVSNRLGRAGVIVIVGVVFWALLALLIVTNGCASTDRTFVGSVNVPVSLRYDWTLNFKEAGPRILTFLFNAVDDRGALRKVGHIEHAVDVKKFGFLSRSQAEGLAMVGAVLSILTGLVGLLRPLAARLVSAPKQKQS